jgi:DNA-binding protein HU-beta
MAGKMTQTQIIAALADKANIAKKDAKAFLLSIADLAHKETKKSGEFTLPGLGKLVKQRRKARTGRNPATGQPIKIPAKTVLKFRIAKAAKDAVLGTVAAKKKR